MNKKKSKFSSSIDAVMKFKHLCRISMNYILSALTIFAVVVFAARLPELHSRLLRSSVGDRVYMIRNDEFSGGGTGFAIKAPSGRSYILTNDHVCGVSKDGLTVLVSSEDDVDMRRKIIAHDGNSDLCLIEGLPDVEGLEVAYTLPTVGDEYYVIGHPLLQPMHVSKGEITGSEDVSIPVGPMAIINPRTNLEEPISPQEGGISAEQCSLNKYSQQLVDMDLLVMVLKVKFCILTVKEAYSTAITIFPGNSGSPLVNFWGNVVGVAFAGNNETNWGMMVSLHDVKEFLKKY